MFTKTQAKVMGVFTSLLTERFSIKQIAEAIGKPYPLVHRSIKGLAGEKFLEKDKQGYLSLCYKQHHQELAYIEALRTGEFLKHNKQITLFVKDAMESLRRDFFILLIFGSFIKTGQKPRDIDILVILENKDDLEKCERVIQNLASNFGAVFDINTISEESAYEMLSKRDERNVMNETLDNHIIIFGAENYYRLLKNAR